MPTEIVPKIAELEKETIVFHNIHSLMAKVEYVRSDDNLMAADVLIFAESHCWQGDQATLALPGFQFADFNKERLRCTLHTSHIPYI